MPKKLDFGDTRLIAISMGYGILTGHYFTSLMYEWFGKENVEFNDAFKIPIMAVVLFGMINGLIHYKYDERYDKDDRNSFWNKYICVYAMTVMIGFAGIYFHLITPGPWMTICSVIGFLLGLLYIKYRKVEDNGS